MPKKKIKEQTEEVLQEVKNEEVISDFSPVEVVCKHQNQDDKGKCLDCNQQV